MCISVHSSRKANFKFRWVIITLEKSKTVSEFEPWPLVSKESIVPPSYDVIGNREHTWVHITNKLFPWIAPSSMTTRWRRIQNLLRQCFRAHWTAYVCKIWFKNINQQYEFQILSKSCTIAIYDSYCMDRTVWFIPNLRSGPMFGILT